MKNYFTFICVVWFMNTVYCQNGLAEKSRKQVDFLETIYLHNCAEKYNYNYRMKEWQECLDEGIKKDSTIAKFWQQ